tara:strand:+ start:1428 stop:1700 length:273 start_codon:yes stop_codon:yes gene_type:complete
MSKEVKMPNKNKLSVKEIAQLSERLNQIEIEQKRAWGLDRISGGFVHANFLDYDNEKIYIEIKDGVQSDCKNRVNTEEVSLWRHNLEYTN